MAASSSATYPLVFGQGIPDAVHRHLAGTGGQVSVHHQEPANTDLGSKNSSVTTPGSPPIARVAEAHQHADVGGFANRDCARYGPVSSENEATHEIPGSSWAACRRKVVVRQTRLRIKKPKLR